MKQKQLTIVAVVCGLVCAACIALFMVKVQGEANAARAEALARYGGEQVEVCVATRDVAAGERVDVSAMESRLWIADLLPDGAVREAQEVSGKTATSSILKGEVISSKRFESAHNALDIPSGKEAVSVPAKAVQAVGGAIRPGMSVDVYSSGDTTTTALARDVIVLDTSVGDSSSLVSSESGWITLAIEPERVQEVIAASSKTSLYFVIPGDMANNATVDVQADASLSVDAGSEGITTGAQSESAEAPAAADSGKSSEPAAHSSAATEKVNEKADEEEEE